MAQPKGKTGNPNGRPKGTPNKTTAEIRNIFQLLLEQNLNQMKADIKALEPKQRLDVLLKLSEFILPKKNEANTTQEDWLSNFKFTTGLDGCRTYTIGLNDEDDDN